MASFFGNEVYRCAFDHKLTPKVSYGLPFPAACKKHVQETFQSSRVFIVSSGSIARKTDALKTLRGVLGGVVVGVRVGITPHTPIAECLEIIKVVRDLNIDCIVTLGAGSVTDSAKLIRFALANSAYTLEEINTLWGGRSDNPAKRKNIRQPTIPMICIPTSLSGGEYQALAGATETIFHSKRIFEPVVNPDLVILDPQLCASTPQLVWLSTGIRAVDHCVETICSLQSTDDADSWAEKGLIKLVTGVLDCKRGLNALQARHRCQLGLLEAMTARSTGVPLGASHAIGHQLGALGVGHGETSCIMLPAVCKYNAAKGANIEKQERVKATLLRERKVSELIQASGLDPGEVDLGDILDVIIRELELPQTLKDVNVGRDQLTQLAQNSLEDMWMKTNPSPIRTKEQVLDILDLVVN